MAASQWAAVVEALAGLVAVTDGFRARGDKAAGKTTTVYVGPEQVSTADPGNWLSVGWTGPGEDAGSWQQTTGPLAATSGRPRDETGIVRCRAAVAVGGLAPLRALAAVEAIVEAVAVVLRTDPALGLSPPLQRMYAQMSGAGAIQWQGGPKGQTCEVVFTVTYQARI